MLTATGRPVGRLQRHAHTADARLVLLALHGEAAEARLADRAAEPVDHHGLRAGGVRRQLCVGGALAGDHGAPERGGEHADLAAHPGPHAHGPVGFHLVQVQDVTAFEDSQVDQFLDLLADGEQRGAEQRGQVLFTLEPLDQKCWARTQSVALIVALLGEAPVLQRLQGSVGGGLVESACLDHVA